MLKKYEQAMENLDKVCTDKLERIEVVQERQERLNADKIMGRFQSDATTGYRMGGRSQVNVASAPSKVN